MGALLRDDALKLPERHLGLVTAAEGPLTSAHRTALADAVERSIDIDRLLSLARAPESIAGEATARLRPTARIGVARDVAFQFYYEENLARLREAGAELVFWSPETDIEIPDVDGLYFGGGYPELRAKALAANASVRRGVAKFIEGGGPVYAECGGLMYLAESLEDLDGGVHEMVGVLPAAVSMRPRRLSLGYTTVTTTGTSLLGLAGTTARGHEFHYSTLARVPLTIPRVYRLTDPRGGERVEGYQIGSALLSYVHLHFASNPSIAAAFVSACARRRA